MFPVNRGCDLVLGLEIPSIGGEVKSKPGSSDYPGLQTFEDSMIRNLAAALRKIKAN
jgi:hypothetical protein